MSSNTPDDAPLETAVPLFKWEQNHRSYLIRLWRDSDTAPWRIVVVNVFTKQTESFSTMQALFLFLHEQTTAAPP